MACPARKPSSEPLCINFSQKLIIYMCFLLFIVATIRPSRPAPPAPAAGRSGSPRPQQPNAVTPRPQQPNGASPGLPQQSPAGPSPGPGQGEIACCHSRCCFLCCSVVRISVLLSVLSNISVAWNAVLRITTTQQYEGGAVSYHDCLGGDLPTSFNSRVHGS